VTVLISGELPNPAGGPGGRRGADAPALDNPASDPHVLAVGAADTRGTVWPHDDVVPEFSSHGSAARGVDLVAPGQSVQSLRTPGSYIDERYPLARINDTLFKGSGSSQAAAVVSGAAALLLEARPELTPDQVKTALTATATPLTAAGPQGQGAGRLNVAAAASYAGPFAAQPWPVSTGLGSLEAARGTHHVADEDVELAGEQDIFGNPWTPATWAPASAAGTAWDGGLWNGAAWAGDSWADGGDGSSWASRTWSSRTWSSRTWSSRTWSSRTWSSRTWSSRTWSAGAWADAAWTEGSWTSRTWSSAWSHAQVR
jgi:serine protease AprX